MLIYRDLHYYIIIQTGMSVQRVLIDAVRTATALILSGATTAHVRKDTC